MSAPDADLDDAEREALNVLRSTSSGEDEPTATVTVGGAELTVTAKLSGELETKFDEIIQEQAKETPRIGAIRDTLIDAICALIVDGPEPSDDPVRWDSPAVWESYYYEAGTEGLLEVFEAVSAPALARNDHIDRPENATATDAEVTDLGPDGE